MELQQAIDERKSYRSLEKVSITKETIKELAEAASLAPSCYNNQPWRYVFVYEDEKLKQLHEALSKGTEWMTLGSMIVAIVSQKELDCVVKNREYYLYDTGMSTAFMMLKATELGLATHLIAGYSETKTKKILGVPDDMTVISLMAVGKKSEEINPLLSEEQAESEGKRPERFPMKRITHHNTFNKEKE